MRVYTNNGMVLIATTPKGLVAVDPITRVTRPATNWNIQGTGGTVYNCKSKITAELVPHGSNQYRIADQAINRPVTACAKGE